ncbi:11620_t:CDS:1, partial [Racocetra fulgida]
MSQTGNRQHNGSQNGERVEIIAHIENMIINENNSQQGARDTLLVIQRESEQTDNNREPSSAELIQQLITGLGQILNNNGNSKEAKLVDLP